MGIGKENRKKAAAKRQEEADKRSAKDQLARLDEMLGKGKGAKQERAKLETRIAKDKEEKAVKKKKKVKESNEE